MTGLEVTLVVAVFLLVVALGVAVWATHMTFAAERDNRMRWEARHEHDQEKIRLLEQQARIMRQRAQELVRLGKTSHSFDGTVPSRGWEVAHNEAIERLTRLLDVPEPAREFKTTSEGLAAEAVLPLPEGMLGRLGPLT